jgi:GNAT superfamily N-acetyltransferase
LPLGQEWRYQRPLCIIQIGWVGLSVHTNKFTQPFSKRSLRQLSSSELSITDEMIETIMAKISNMSQLEHMKVFGYEKDGKIIGTCTIGRVEGLSKGCRPFAVIENVVVLDSIRCHGIGKQLVCHAIAQAEKWNYYKVILETGTKSEWELRFYENCGLTRGDKTAFMKRF